jgi:hypothetical protein
MPTEDAITAPRMEAPIKAGYMEELRFAKRQQWAVAAATITFIAGAFHMSHSVKQPLACWEKWIVTFLISIIATGGIGLLFDLQGHLRGTRRVIDPADPNPLWRGMPIAVGLAIALSISAIAVIYSLWRD